MPPKIRDILEMLHRDGWQQVVQRGSHRQFKHPVKAGRVTVLGEPGDDVAAGTLDSIPHAGPAQEVTPCATRS